MNTDYQLFTLINQFAGKIHLLDQLIVLFTKYGALLFGLCLLWLWFSKKGNEQQNRNTVLLAVTAACIGLGINQLIGAVYFRPRPFSEHLVTLLLDKSTDPSFPSDHSTGAFALSLMVSWKNKKMGLVMLVMAVLLAVSRVFVGTHYPLDVTGGALMGLIGCVITRWQGHRLQPIFSWILSKWKKIELKTLKNDM